jgi:hypothetical protein
MFLRCVDARAPAMKVQEQMACRTTTFTPHSVRVRHDPRDTPRNWLVGLGSQRGTFSVIFQLSRTAELGSQLGAAPPARLLGRRRPSLLHFCEPDEVGNVVHLGLRAANAQKDLLGDAVPAETHGNDIDL